MKFYTARKYDFFEVSSSMQKAIRRGLTKLAGYFALELYNSGYSLYVWKRLLVISAEDCGGTFTREIWALYEAFELVNKGKKDYEKGRIFISKAVIILCKSPKNRDADHLQNLIYDKKIDVSDEEITSFISECGIDEKLEIPEWAFDVHTQRGRKAGKSKKDFFKEELAALQPKEVGLFDQLVKEL